MDSLTFSDEEWQSVLQGLKDEILRNQVMLLIAYDRALRREELVRLEIADFDFAHRQIRVQAEHAKNRSERIVGYGTTTSQFLQAYLQHRRTLSPKPGPLFLSESHRNFAGPLSLVMWSKVVQKMAGISGVPQFTTHTPRHLRLTHMARARMDLHQIATYAGHRLLGHHHVVHPCKRSGAHEAVRLDYFDGPVLAYGGDLPLIFAWANWRGKNAFLP